MGGGDDTINVADGDNWVLGGIGNDIVNTGPGRDVIFGDYGDITRDAAEKLERAATVVPSIGGNDTIDSGAGDDIVIGGTADDQITTQSGDDIVIGDAATITARHAISRTRAVVFTGCKGLDPDC